MPIHPFRHSFAMTASIMQAAPDTICRIRLPPSKLPWCGIRILFLPFSPGNMFPRLFAAYRMIDDTISAHAPPKTDSKTESIGTIYFKK